MDQTVEITWFSVEENLPNDRDFVIYHAPGIFETGPQMWFGRYLAEDNVFSGSSGFFGGGEVSHWAYPPDLPE